MFDVTIRPMQPGEEDLVCRVISGSYDEYIAPDNTPEGNQEFYHFANARDIARRASSGGLVLLAWVNETLAGMIEMRENYHIALYFVSPDYQRQGIARQLWNAARAICLERDPNLKVFTVNSSPYAVPIYERLGFVPSDEEQIRDGIRFIPMRLTLE